MDKSSRKEILLAYKERKIVGGICAIKNLSNGKRLLEATNDIKGSRNRMEFTKKTNSCIHMRLQSEWKALGSDSFEFEVIEELEKKDTQTDKEFRDDLEALLELWSEKLGKENIY